MEMHVMKIEYKLLNRHYCIDKCINHNELILDSKIISVDVSYDL